ncbi:hypothetical protein FRB94_004023 [Tulasnella sp. JGI-2019a]|nr:hypothetical protein FRB93_003355 [Tulasnella sp. JGI-2019a]KAG9002280.1 hypothetical protein FRB94_004023 [Tulasnella sp. JGI-2019a]
MRRASSSALKLLHFDQSRNPCIASRQFLTASRYSSATACIMRHKTDMGQDYHGRGFNQQTPVLPYTSRQSPIPILGVSSTSLPDDYRPRTERVIKQATSATGQSKWPSSEDKHASSAPNVIPNAKGEQDRLSAPDPGQNRQPSKPAWKTRKRRDPASRNRRLLPLARALKDGATERAWAAYQELRARDSDAIQDDHLHTLFALLTTNSPVITRTIYDRLHDIIHILCHRGPGRVREWEWNALMSAAAKGFRTTTKADYQSAVTVLEEWVKEVERDRQSKSSQLKAGQPGAGVGAQRGKHSQTSVVPTTEPKVAKLVPTITTFNILISIACHTHDFKLVQDAYLRWRLHRPHLHADRYTYLPLITWRIRKHKLHKVPALVEQMVKKRFGIGIDGVNAIIWAYARLRDATTGSRAGPDVAMEIYDFLLENDRRRTLVAHDPRSSSLSKLRRARTSDFLYNPILGIPKLVETLRRVVPDYRTHIMIIQHYSYRGDLSTALRALQNLLDLLNREQDLKSPSDRSMGPFIFQEPIEGQLMSAFRGLFKAFAKYGPRGTGRSLRTHHPLSLQEATTMGVQSSVTQGDPSSLPFHSAVTDVPNQQFTLNALLYVFHTYMQLSSSHPFASSRRLPPVSFVRDILMAFTHAGFGDNLLANRELMRSVWQKVVRDRLVVCGDEWEQVKNIWVWKKVRRDFRIDLTWERFSENEDVDAASDSIEREVGPSPVLERRRVSG